MVETVHIPKALYDAVAPCWIPTKNSDGWCKPIIRCKCGKYCGIGLHHVHPDGRVTESFYHANVKEFTHKGKVYHCEPGCDWHVYLILDDYDCGDFPPVED